MTALGTREALSLSGAEGNTSAAYLPKAVQPRGSPLPIVERYSPVSPFSSARTAKSGANSRHCSSKATSRLEHRRRGSPGSNSVRPSATNEVGTSDSASANVHVTECRPSWACISGRQLTPWMGTGGRPRRTSGASNSARARKHLVSLVPVVAPPRPPDSSRCSPPYPYPHAIP